MKIVVLGATGYLGRKITRILAQDGHDLLCIVNAIQPKREHRIKLADNVREIGIEDFFNSSAQIDCYINLCCRYQRKEFSDQEIFDSNLYTPLNVFIKCIELGMKRHITVDTSLPKELNTYCISKKEYANIVHWYSDNNTNISVINILLENFYGEDEPLTIVIKQEICLFCCLY